MKLVKSLKEIKNGDYLKVVTKKRIKPSGSETAISWDTTYFKCAIDERSLRTQNYFIDFKNGEFKQVNSTTRIFGDFNRQFFPRENIFLITEEEYFEMAGKYLVVENI